MKIWKLTLEQHHSLQTFRVPAGSHKLLHVDNQRDQLCVWILVNDMPLVTREKKVNLVAYFTGDGVTEGDKYVGTCTINKLVWHIFERVAK